MLSSLLVGFSLGGFVAQEMAIAYPDRVRSLTLMSTAADPTDSSLPGPRLGWLVRSTLGELPLLRYRLRSGEQNTMKERIARWIAFCGQDNLDIGDLAEVVLYDLRERRGVNLRALIQHQAAVAATRSRYLHLVALTAPTLVVHGTADPLIPVDHGEKLSELIPGAQHVWLEGIGHQFPYPARFAVVDAVLAHLDLAT
ncbi:MAG: alpha/beta hydrolase [Acidimicrobiales bacterium]